jgi:hypothetical protein
MTTQPPEWDEAVADSRSLGPPFAAERRIPTLDPTAAARPLPNWRWGEMDPSFRATVNTVALGVVRDHVTAAGAAIRANPRLAASTRDITPFCTATVNPGAAASEVLDQLAANPVAILEGVLGHPAAAPVSAPAAPSAAPPSGAAPTTGGPGTTPPAAPTPTSGPRDSGTP